MGNREWDVKSRSNTFTSRAVLAAAGVSYAPRAMAASAHPSLPAKTPAELLARTDDGVCIDTGWWATQGYDPVRAIEELGDRILHVHLKDVLEGTEHVTCRWGLGCVDVEGCIRALQRLGYADALSVEHEPEHEDPSEDCRAMRAMLEGWLQ